MSKKYGLHNEEHPEMAQMKFNYLHERGNVENWWVIFLALRKIYIYFMLWIR